MTVYLLVFDNNSEDVREVYESEADALAAAVTAAQDRQRAGDRVPDDVFMTPDGGVMFLWAAADGAHEYYDFPPDGPPQRMTTFADGRPAVFTKLADLGIPLREVSP